MNQPTRLRKRRAPQQKQLISQQTLSGASRRRSSRLHSKQIKSHKIEGFFEQQQEIEALEPVETDYFVSLVPSNPSLKRYRPEAVDRFVIQWLESGTELQSYRETNREPDTLLGACEADPIPERLTESAPNMGCTKNTDGFALPPIPISTGSRSYRVDTEDESRPWNTPSVVPSGMSGASTNSIRKKVEDPYYRDNNLAENNIYIRAPCEKYPEHIANLVDQIRNGRNSPGSSLDQFEQDKDLDNLEMGTGEPSVEAYFDTNVFPNPKFSDSLKRTQRNPMAKHVVPDIGSRLKVSTPVPDMLYGYNRPKAFPQQQIQLRSMGNEMVANTQGLIYPFFVTEFKADGPGRSGSMWVATNQCVGGSVSCVSIVERLNHQLRGCKKKKVKLVNSAAFSIAMSGTEARLYVSWKQNENDYFMQRVQSFLLQDPKHYMEFRNYVRNIIDWGKGNRLEQIQHSLDMLLEESRIISSERAKSRPLPWDDCASRSTHKLPRMGEIVDHSSDDI